MKHTFVIDRHRHKDMHLLVRVLRIRVYTGACTHDIHKRMHLRFECGEGESERERERGGPEGCEVQESLRVLVLLSDGLPCRSDWKSAIRVDDSGLIRVG